jgi:hypothetical protein
MLTEACDNAQSADAAGCLRCFRSHVDGSDINHFEKQVLADALLPLLIAVEIPRD